MEGLAPSGDVGSAALTRERALRELVESVAVSVDAAGTAAQVLDAALVAIGRWSGWPAGHGVLVDADGSISQSTWWTGQPGRFPEPDRPPALPVAAPLAGTDRREPHDAAIAPRGLADLQEVAGVGPLLEAGLEQVCSLALPAGGHPLGVLHLYSPVPAPDLGELSEVLDSVTSLVGRALDRRRSELVRAREVEERLAEARSHDPLTGLANRKLFAEQLDRALERARRHRWSTTVLAVNVDDFSSVNDRFGPDVGDEVLVVVAERLHGVIRSSDGLTGPPDAIARVGSDDFLLLVEDVDEPAAATVAQRVLDTLAAPSGWSDEGLTLTATVGIAVRAEGAGSALTMIADAQAARRHAKRRSSATYEFYAEELRVASRARSAMAADLEQALEVGQFVLHYQPQVQVTTGRVLGVEALVRWQHPERGLVPPYDFIPVAETTGLIVPLGSWVLQEACRQAARWRAELPEQERLAVSVNVSARQFSCDLVGTVRAALSATGLDPTAVVLEVTESVVMDDVDYAVQVLRDVKDLGASISIDDFGTGYSSLAYLKRLPLDELKIDRSFISGLGTDPEDTAIAGAVTAMAHALGLQVVAEGVETPLQLDRLRSLGCDAAQGYHFSRPVPVTSVPELLGGQRPDWTGSPGGATPDVVLVADDSPEVRQLAVISLSTAGFDVHEAVDGRAALQLARTLRPDCLVLDVRMPHLTGYEVCRAVREDPRLASCTVVMLTSGAAPQDKLDGYSAGADDYLVKPFTPRELVSRIRHAMNARSASSLRHSRG